MGEVISSRNSLARPAIGRMWLAIFLAGQVVLWTAVVVWDPPEMEGPLKVAVGLWPGSETLTRQLTAMFDEFFGPDPEGHSRIERVLVPVCDGYPADF